jgi:hypothetical protein
MSTFAVSITVLRAKKSGIWRIEREKLRKTRGYPQETRKRRE